MACDSCLFELGSVSLKFHHRPRGRGPLQKIKVPWKIGHEVFETGLISRESTAAVAGTIRSIFRQYRCFCDPARTLAFATGVFRAAQNSLQVIRQVEEEIGMRVRVLTGDQEAALLKAAFLELLPARPAFAFDLGGGSLQWVLLGEGRRSERGSLALGAIRIQKMLGESAFSRFPDLAAEVVDRYFCGMPEVRVGRLCGTGGAVKAITSLVRRPVCNVDQLDALDREVRRDGPPAALKAHRRPIFLPGLTVVRRLLAETGASELQYLDLSVGRALLRKVLPYYENSRAGAPSASSIVRSLGYSSVLS